MDLSNVFRLPAKPLAAGDFVIGAKHSGPPSFYRAIPNPRTVITIASGAIPTAGAVLLARSDDASNLTLAQPGAADDTLRIVDVSGKAHTISTGSNGINGSMNLITFSGNKGASITLLAYAGVWYAVEFNDVEITND
jgi:hypothetical protein